MLEERFILLHKGAAAPEQDKNLRQLLFSQMVLSFRDIEVFFKKANPSGQTVSIEKLFSLRYDAAF